MAVNRNQADLSVPNSCPDILNSRLRIFRMICTVCKIMIHIYLYAVFKQKFYGVSVVVPLVKKNMNIKDASVSIWPNKFIRNL